MGFSKSSATGRGQGSCWDHHYILCFAPAQGDTKGNVSLVSLFLSFQALLTILTEGEGTDCDVCGCSEEVLLQSTGGTRPSMVSFASPHLPCPSLRWAKER